MQQVLAVLADDLQPAGREEEGGERHERAGEIAENLRHLKAAHGQQPERQQALRQLAVLGGRRVGTALGSAAGELLLNIPVLAAAQLAAGAFLPNAYYPWQARAVLSAALAVLAALCYLAAGAARRFQRVLAVLLPLWCFGNVFFSGALTDPARLPYGLGALRLFSPAWYGLRLLESFL